MVAVREEMKRKNDIMTSYLIHQEKSGQKEALFMALQVLLRDSEEYRTLSRQLICSVSGGSKVHEIRRNSFPSLSQGGPVINRAETAVGERRRNESRRRSRGYETNVIINPRMEVANERRANEHQPAFSRQQPSQDERAYPSFDRFTAKKS